MTTVLQAARCICGSALRVCRGCDQVRCFKCAPLGSGDCDGPACP